MRLAITSTFAVLLLWPAWVQGQSAVTDIIQPVTIKNNVYEQSFSAQPDNSCLVRLTVLDTKKGEEVVYELNAADLNHRAVSFDTRKNVVRVEATTQGKRDLIRMYEDGQVDGYENELSVLVPGIEEARELVDALKEMIQQCQEQTTEDETAGLGAPELTAYLESQVGDIDLNGAEFAQVITHDESQPAIITYQRTDSDKGDEYRYTVNLADLDPRSINFDTKGAIVWVIAKTQGGRDLVQVEENGQTDGYEDEIAIIATDIEHARRLEKAWSQLAAASEGSPEFIAGQADPSIPATLEYLAEHITPLELGETTYEQGLSYEKNTRNGGGGYLLTYQVTDASEGESESFLWNMADMHPASIQFDIKKNQVIVEVQTLNKSDLIAYTEEGVLDGYTNGLGILAGSIEEARRLTQAFQHLAKKINDQPVALELPATPSAALSFLQERVTEITIGDEQYSQSIEAQGDGACMILYRVVDQNDGNEVAYEWNMSDIDESSISLGTKGNAVFASLETIGRRDLIEVLENDEVDDYEKSLSIRTTGVEEAREVVAALKHLAGLCKEQSKR